MDRRSLLRGIGALPLLVLVATGAESAAPAPRVHRTDGQWRWPPRERALDLVVIGSGGCGGGAGPSS